jgi:NAD(P)H-hydrate epimerase
LVIGGSRGKSGAPALSGRAALRAGAGLVTVAAPAGVVGAVAASMPELMTEPLGETPDGAAEIQDIAGLAEGKTVLAVGPGMGVNAETQQFIRTVVREAAVPVIVDADGLNAFTEHIGELCGEPARPVVVTPHPGEMARLIGRDTAFIAADRAGAASDLARRNNLYVILKGYRTIVATPDGAVYVNPTGNPGMATGGSGDILTGLLAGIVAQPLGSFTERLCLAVYLHGLAGDLAAAALGEESVVAGDLLLFLPEAREEIRKR